MFEILVGTAGIVCAIPIIISVINRLRKKKQSGINGALEIELQQSIMGFAIVTEDGATHSYEHPKLSKQISVDTRSQSLPASKPEPSARARELAEQVPESADPYSRALKAIAGKELDKARGLLEEAEKAGVEKMIKIYQTRGMTEYYDGFYSKVAVYFQKVLEHKPDDLYWLQVTGNVLEQAGEYEAGVPVAEKAVKISEDTYGSNHEQYATSLNNLALLYKSQGYYDKAEPLYERALKISESVLGEQHPSVATSLNNLALLYQSQGYYDKAEPLYERALKIRESVLGEQHPSVATSLNNLALLYQSQGYYDKAEPLYERALKIDEIALGENHPLLATDLNNLAVLYNSQGYYDKAEPYYQRAIKILETATPNHPNLAVMFQNYAGMLFKAGRKEEAKLQFQKAEAIKAKQAERE